MTGPLLYEVTVPYFRKALENQVKILKKGKEWCKENGHEEAKLSEARLVDDMFVGDTSRATLQFAAFTYNHIGPVFPCDILNLQ